MRKYKMDEKNKETQEGMSDEELNEVSGGRTDIYKFYHIGEGSEPVAIVEVNDGKPKWTKGNAGKLNDRDKSQLSDSVKKKVRL